MAKIGVMNEKGKLNQLILGYQKYVQIKIALSTKLAMTVQDRKKLKLEEKPDAIQLEFENFMKAAV
jgi:hypothetical protein